jgi:adenylate cyclase
MRRPRLGADVDPDRLFHEASIAAERTVAIVRIVVALILGVVFVLAVVTQIPDADAFLHTQIRIAALTIGGYIVLGVASLRLASPAHFRPWMAWLFVTLDVAFILASVWAGLANVGVGGRYAMILPVIWFVPVVLAFGALRYDPLLQAYVGVLLAGGFLGAALADRLQSGPSSEPPHAAVARFVALPPNVMRAAMVALAAMVLTIAALRARRLLIRAIAEARRSANLTRYLPPQIADWLGRTSADDARRGSRHDVAVLFVDIREFTTITEAMDPSGVGRLLGEFRRRIAVVCDRHGGVIDKFIGDGAMIVFGVPEPGVNDARAALACARELAAMTEEWNRQRTTAGEPPVAVGVGGHFGPAFCGAVGDESRLEFTVIGDTVNVASRLEAATKLHGYRLIVSRPLLAAAGLSDAADWIALPAQTIRGRQQSIELVALRASATEADRVKRL